MDRPEELNLRILERNNLSNNQNILFTPRSYQQNIHCLNLLIILINLIIILK